MPFAGVAYQRFSEIDDVRACPGIYEISTTAGTLLKVGIAENLRDRLKTHRASYQSGLKGWEHHDPLDPTSIVSKKSILAKHLFFDDEIAPDLELKTQNGRRAFLLERCRVRVRATATRAEAARFERELEVRGLYRYVGDIRVRPVRGDRFVLDSNIWDKLAEDPHARDRLRALCRNGSHEILVPSTVRGELEASHFAGVPSWFPVTLQPDSVFVLGFSLLGEARVSEGAEYVSHLGTSRKIADAAVADTAATDGAMLVSEDRRARTRFATLRGNDRAFDYARFRKDVLSF